MNVFELQKEVMSFEAPCRDSPESGDQHERFETRRMSVESTIHVVESEAASRQSLRQLLQAAGFNAATHESAESFLQHFTYDEMVSQCLLLEMRLPGLSGLGLQRKLNEDDVGIPVVFLSDSVDVPTTVQAMKYGAVNVLEKPVQPGVLLESLMQALDLNARKVEDSRKANALRDLVASLSKREKQVMALLLNARNTKEIAATLSISQQTVAKHRTAVLEKLEVDSVPALLNLDHGDRRLMRYCISEQSEPESNWS